MRKRNLQSDNDSRRSSIASVDTESSSSSSQVSEPREIPSLEALNHIEKELKKIKKETQKKLDVFNIVPKAWLSFHKSRDLSQEQAVYEQKVSDFIESLHDYRSKLREAHRDAKRGKRPLGIVSTLVSFFRTPVLRQLY